MDRFRPKTRETIWPCLHRVFLNIVSANRNTNGKGGESSTCPSKIEFVTTRNVNRGKNGTSSDCVTWLPDTTVFNSNKRFFVLYCYCYLCSFLSTLLSSLHQFSIPRLLLLTKNIFYLDNDTVVLSHRSTKSRNQRFKHFASVVVTDRVSPKIFNFTLLCTSTYWIHIHYVLIHEFLQMVKIIGIEEDIYSNLMSFCSFLKECC